MFFDEQKKQIGLYCILCCLRAFSNVSTQGLTAIIFGVMFGIDGPVLCP
jgi:hypothetical protein